MKRLLILLLSLLATPALASPGPGFFQPPKPAAVTSTMVGWWEGDAGIVISAGTVSSWIDQSGHSHNWSQYLTNSLPTSVANAQNGRPVVRFDGSTQLLAQTPFLSTSGSAKAEIWIVLKSTLSSASNNGGPWYFGASGDNGFYPFSDGNIYDDFGGSARHSFAAGAGVPQAAAIYRVVVNGSSSWTAYLNGSQVFTTASNTVPSMSLNVIGYNLSVFWKGDIAEILLYQDNLSAGDVTTNTNYLKKKYATP